MTREEAIQWLKVINTKEFGWDEYAMQYSQREIRERCEQGVRKAIDMAIEALQADAVHGKWVIRENGNKECSLCGHERQDGWDYFCGYCGARMKGGTE